MLSVERQNQILLLLKANKSVMVSELAKTFFVSEATIRRDLARINKQKLIKRTYGGAILLEAFNHPLPISIREKEYSLEKDIIGKLAASFICDFDSVIIDSSSTALSVVKYLSGLHDLTIITNSIKAMSLIEQSVSHKLLCTGGESYDNTLSLVGASAEDFIKHYNANKLFFSCRAISQKYISDLASEEASLRNVMISQSEKVFLMADHSKFDTTALANICDFADIDYFITDIRPPDNWMEYFEKTNTIVVYPNSDSITV
ncbi:MAG: DeoR/GlpR family DNA-binding transcription regulator [Hydrogenoanaerobacterium sp.]